MALDKIQNLPKDQPGAAGVLTQTIGVLVGIIILACWAATEFAAWRLAFQPALGEPLASLGGFKVYSPFDYFLWLLRFGHVEGTERAFDGGAWVLASLHFLVVPAIWMAVRRAKKYGGKTDMHGSARWAEKEDIYDTTLLRRPPTRFQELKNVVMADPAGQIKGSGCYVGAWVDPETMKLHYLIHDGPEHILAFAPTRSGKGVGLVLPTLLSWPHSSVTHDLKGEAWALTAGYRRAKGHKVLKFEPANEDGSSIRFNPLEEIRLRTMKEVADAQNVAGMIVDPDGKGMDDHWAKTGHELLSAALLHILYASPNKTLRGLVSFFCDPSMSIEQVAESMLNTEHDPTGSQGWEDPITGRPVKVHPVIAESARSFLNKSENERSGVQSTAMSYLSLYREPIVAMNTAVSEFRVRDLMHSDTPVDLYIVVPPDDLTRLRPLIRLLLNQILRQNMQKMEFADGRSVAGYKHRLLFLLDEFPALGKIESIESNLAYMAGYGMKAYVICQDLSQLYKAYTKDESVISNCHIRVAYAPNKIETAELLSKYCGVMTVNKQQRSYSGSRLNPFLMHVMAAEQETQRPLLTPDECLRIPGPQKDADGKNILSPGDMLILPAGAPPIYGRQILYFKDPIFDGRSKIKPPKTSDRLMDRPAARRPIPCDPKLAAVVAAPLRESGLDDMVPVEGAAAPKAPPAAASPGAATPAPAPAPAPAPIAAVAEAASALTSKPTFVSGPAAGAPTSAPAAPEKALVPPAPRVESETAPAKAAVAAAAVAAVAYSAEELAALDAEAEGDGDGRDAEVERDLRAEAAQDEDERAGRPSLPPPTPSQFGEGGDLLDFEI